MVFEGVIEFRYEAIGSKSEGSYAHLLTADGNDWILYRPGCLAWNDRYFEPFHGYQVRIEGEPENRTRHILVNGIWVRES